MINFRKELRKAQQLAKRKQDLEGTGSFVFENNTNGDLNLPRPTTEGVRNVKKGGQFIGDSYYFFLLKSGEIRLVKELNDQTPEKMFMFKNFNLNEVRLPEPNRDGMTIIAPNGEFIGDSRFFPMLRSGHLKLIKEVDIPMQENKLITEQPPTVTHQGQVEYVVDNGEQQLTETKKKRQGKELKEDALEGVKLLLD
jgi:hypothetical protein